MSLSFPSRVGDQVPSSSEASDNINKLLHVDQRGGKDQVATRVALNCFERIGELKPGYFSGLKTWAKSGCIYVGAGVATAGALTGSGYGLYKLGERAYSAGYGTHLLGFGALMALIELVGTKTGIQPVTALVGLAAVTVRDSAQRAAKAAVKSDERSREIKEKEAENCHKEILDQLTNVYQDCAKHLSEKGHSGKENKLRLKDLGDQLSQQIPQIESLLKQLNLEKHEIEIVLQRFKDQVRFLQSGVCRLQAEPGFEKDNAELLANWAEGSLPEIVVPSSIRDRVAAVHRNHFGILQKAKGYCSSAFSTIKTLAVATTVITLAAAGYDAYHNGSESALGKLSGLITNRQISDWTDLTSVLGWKGAGIVGVVLPTAAVAIKTGLAHNRAIRDNQDYVDRSFDQCATELKSIYDGVQSHLDAELTQGTASLKGPIKKRLPLIRHEISQLGIVQDPSEILGRLEQRLA